MAEKSLTISTTRETEEQARELVYHLKLRSKSELIRDLIEKEYHRVFRSSKTAGQVSQ